MSAYPAPHFWLSVFWMRGIQQIELFRCSLNKRNASDLNCLKEIYSLQRQMATNNWILRIFWTYLTDNESVFILSTNWVWVKCRKSGFQIEKRVACWGRVQCRLNLSLLELQFSFSEWLTDNSWKENGIFSAAKQELQVAASAYKLPDCYCD